MVGMNKKEFLEKHGKAYFFKIKKQKVASIMKELRKEKNDRAIRNIVFRHFKLN